MVVGVLKEVEDPRVAIIPDIAKKLIDEGNQVIVETKAGEKAYFNDQTYTEVGAECLSRKDVLSKSEILISIHPVSKEEMKQKGNLFTYVSSFAPFVTDQYLKDASEAGINVLSLDMIPRSTIAQSMDVLSSMASIAGYKSVLEAARLMPRYFPMMTTAAGSIPPAKVLVLGAGVAGLQAIATAKRLGSVVEAFDTRSASKEEVESLGAKFVEVEGATDDSSAGGYAVEQTEEYKQRQRALISEKVKKSDVVITTARLRGKPAPTLVTKEMVEGMKAGSIIVDLAASTGGNCELTEDRKLINHKEVMILGNSDLESTVPQHASQLYSKNIHNYLGQFLKEGKLELDMENDIIKSSLIVKEGEILYNQPIAAV